MKLIQSLVIFALIASVAFSTEDYYGGVPYNKERAKSANNYRAVNAAAAAAAASNAANLHVSNDYA